MTAAKTAWSIRARVIAAVMTLTGLALLLSGVVIYVQGEASTRQRVISDLAQAADEVSKLSEGNDPRTGQPFTGVEPLLRASMERAVHPPAESSFAIYSGKIRWTAPDGVLLRPEEDPELVAAVLPLASGERVVQGDLTTAIRKYHYIVVPVHGQAANDSGALVRVADMRMERAALQPVYLTYTLVALGSLLLVAMLIWLFVGRLLQPLSWMRQTAERITETDISQRIPVRGNDDLSALAGTVNGMLDRLEAAVGAQRDLLDDVGHELRTPLTIVRGHLELMDARDAEDVTATRALVLDELDRMRRLVDDLLTLAKAEQPDFVMTESVDVARLTDETLAKASTLGERHWVLDDLADAEVRLDPQRVAQAWLQLAANAVQYSPDGSTVGMGSRLADGELWLWVRDQGVGIPEAEREGILSRKVMGRGGTGTGLGLAIVSSIATAHGGRVDIESAEGVGSRFSIVIPTQAAPHEEEDDEPDTDR
ncbi:MAG: HAMP domain-containing sensor histidine kinase [Propionicimonas sp.]